MTNPLIADTQVVRYAGFWIRVLASIIDSLILAIIFVPLIWLFFGKDFSKIAPTNHFNLLNHFFSWILGFLYSLLFWRYRNATPGKMLFSLIIVDAKTLQSPSTRQLIFRYLGYFVSGLCFFLGYLWIAFDQRKQGWHDKLASTVVIKK